MAKRIDYYGTWKSEAFRCPERGWRGTVEDGSVDYHCEWLDSSCPNCSFLLTTVSYPSDWETEAKWDKLTAQEKESFRAHKKFLAAQKKSSFMSESDLPVLNEASLTMTRDDFHSLIKISVIFTKRENDQII